jgi:hypothetical protein
MDLNDLIGDLYDDDRRKIAPEAFDEMILRLKLKPEYQIFLDNDNDVIINEEWSSPVSDNIKANRIYKFDLDFIDFIQPEDRVSVLKDVLDIYVTNEYFEMAAVIRDIINDLDK